MYLTHLVKGQKIRIIKSFQSFDKVQIDKGRVLTFIGYSFFPYDDGYSFSFEEGGFRLSGNVSENMEILGKFDQYFELLPD